MLKKLRTVIFHTNELRAARDWYTKVLGKPPHTDEPHYVGFDIGGSELGLDPDMTNIQEGNRTVAYWAVDDVTVASTHFISGGASLVQPVTDVGDNIMVAVVSDPYGNHIGLIQGA